MCRQYAPMPMALFLVVATLLSANDVPRASLPLAETAADHCMYQVALDILAKSPTAEQESRQGKMLKARLLIQLRKGEEAIGILQALETSSSREEEADRYLALALAQSAAEKLGAAEQSLDRAAKAGADRDLVESARAGLRIQAKRFSDAEKMLRAVLKRSPLLSGALYNLAVIRVQQGELAEAAAPGASGLACGAARPPGAQERPRPEEDQGDPGAHR
ncbi:tetratricopeptide repeat protein [Myxococcus sp. CA040A]|uniref:tetratricopeptide repeat protein n=1 Tax=Myxococcus sp. CA040A TaxID=2741738 RepID=UPI001C2CC9DB|nr:tetratricopeptide repeat protein [Myxococcus sp. CA040A]NTX03887.1 tetratricopeptide repeat protein [Myxococcus sp. CA040A]